MKRTLLLAVVVGLLVGGCGMSSKDRLDLIQEQVEKYEQASKALTEQVSVLQVIAEESKEAMGDPNLLPEQLAKIQTTMLEAIEKVGEVNAQKENIDKQLEGWKAALKEASEGEPTIGDELLLYGQGATAIGQTLPPPWNAWAIGIGSVVSAIGGVLVKGAKDKVVLKDVTKSVDKLLESELVSNSKEAKKVLSDSQLDSTRAVLRKVLS